MTKKSITISSGITLKEFRSLSEDLPEDTPITFFNTDDFSIQFYQAKEHLPISTVSVMDGVIVLDDIEATS